MREPGTAILNVPTPEQMQALGRAIGAAIDAVEAAFIIALEGELGAGKTTLVGGILRALWNYRSGSQSHLHVDRAV